MISQLLISHSVLMTRLMFAQVVAQEGAEPEAPGGIEGLFAQNGQMIMLVLMFAAIYFLLIRPMGKRRKDQQRLVSSLKKGDEVITNGGILGRVHAVDDRFVALEVSDKVRIRILKAQVAGRYQTPGQATTDKSTVS